MSQAPDLVSIEQAVQTYVLGLPRLYLVFTIMPIFSKRLLGGAMIRNGVVLSLAVFLFPINQGTLPLELSLVQYFSILIKEAVLGLTLGLVATIPFWVAEGVGFFIDNQRGAAMASSVNPMLGEQTSPLGIFLSQVFITLFVISGALVAFIFILMESYIIWPVGSLLPNFLAGIDHYVFAQLDLLTKTIVIFAAPVIIAMFIAEFSLGLISRFAPQLNVFFLAMPIKSAIGFLVLVIYMRMFIGHITAMSDDLPDKLFEFMTSPLIT